MYLGVLYDDQRALKIACGKCEVGLVFDIRWLSPHFGLAALVNCWSFS